MRPIIRIALATVALVIAAGAPAGAGAKPPKHTITKPAHAVNHNQGKHVAHVADLRVKSDRKIANIRAKEQRKIAKEEQKQDDPAKRRRKIARIEEKADRQVAKERMKEQKKETKLLTAKSKPPKQRRWPG